MSADTIDIEREQHIKWALEQLYLIKEDKLDHKKAIEFLSYIDEKVEEGNEFVMEIVSRFLSQ
tara:strand:- start:23 stop:211 length:189 start_codon:yes stop_codon:yes gene_type:complete